jgi:hypothetical protein
METQWLGLRYPISSDGDIKIQDTSGLIAIANAIKNMGALSSLGLSRNIIDADGARYIHHTCAEDARN